MSKPQYSEIIHRNFSQYEKFLQEVKIMEMPYTVRGKGIKHKKSSFENLKGNAPVSCSEPYGKITVHCEIKSEDSLKYSISLLCSDLKDRMLSRFDSLGGTHRNDDVPDIPLEMQSAPSPHFHAYWNNDYFLAQHVNFEGNSGESIDIDKGFEYFCTQNNIKPSEADKTIEIQILRPPTISGLTTDDPHQNKDFII